MNKINVLVNKYLFNIIRFINIGSLLLLTACSNVNLHSTHRGKIDKNIDINRISDAVPRKESKSRYGNPRSYVVLGKRYYVLQSSKGFVEKGLASWYGADFHGKRTSSGETYNMYAMTAAHKNLPLPTYVQVRNIKNGRKVIVKVNDRGPFHQNRIIDLSYTAALKLDIVRNGTALVEVRAIDPDNPHSIVAGQHKNTSIDAMRIHNGNIEFYIQVGSFRKLANAKKLKKKLAPFGKYLVKIYPSIVNGNRLYRVRFGPLTNIDLADSIVSRLSNYGVLEHHIVVN